MLFRMGDFYETFYDDAKICAQVLGISLTSRNKNSDNPVPLAGLPYHALDSYLPRLIKAGYKVAVCEQVEDPATAKGVVKRDVVRLITPGTLTEDNLLGGAAENYLAAICFDSQGKGAKGSDKVGIAWVDLSTGQFYAQVTNIRYLIDELVRISPSECLITEDKEDLPSDFGQQLEDVIGTVVSTRPGWSFDKKQGYQELSRIFQAGSLEGFGFAEPDSSIAAAGVIVEYLKETQKIALDHISSLRKINRDHFLQLDQTTLRSLEIERTIRDGSTSGSLLGSLNHALTAMGSRKLRHWICYPLNNLEEIQRRQGAVAELVGFDNTRDQLRAILKNVTDIERISTRISTGRTVPRDLLGLAQALRQLPDIRQQLKDCCSELLVELSGQCDDFDSLAGMIENSISPDAGLSIRDGNIICPGYNEQVDHLRGVCRDGQSWLANYQKKLIEETGLPNLKVGYNKVFGYYVELSRIYSEKVPAYFVRKQTLKNAERYITDELKQYETEALTAEQRCKELEERLFQEIRREVASHTLRLQQVAETVAEIDVLSTFAYLARSRNYCRPEVHEGHDLEIKEGRHPVLDVQLGGKFVPNDVALGGRFGDVGIITGPNMSGKSTYIRQTALLVLLAHTGSYIPARSGQVGLTDRIFTRVGASDELSRGQSTFMVEMVETANIINNATDRSIVILDEVGRGTSTYDGLSLAWAITEHISSTIKCRTLFATHYHEITELSELYDNVKNYNVAVREWKDDVVFLHKILKGRTDKSYGIHVARLAGLPKEIISRSNEILQELESNFSKEAHRPELAGKLGKKDSVGQMALFNNHPPDPLLEKLKQVDLDNLTPLQAINLLHEIKTDLENR